MKTLVFVSSHQLEFCDFCFTSQVESELRIVLLEVQERVDLLSPEILNKIDKVYYCFTAHAQDPVSGLSYESTYQALAKDIALGYQDIHLYSFYEFNVHLVGRLREEFSIAGQKGKDYIAFRDKCVMKEHVAKAGLRVPLFEILNEAQLQQETDIYFQALKHKYQLPFICKPISGAASIGVHKIHNFHEFETLKHKVQCSNLIYEVEEYIQGTLYHCDLILQKSQTIFAACGEYTYPNLETTQGKIMGSITLPEKDLLRQELVSFAEKCLTSLNLQDGPAHMEIFVSDYGELVFLEVGARPPGLDACRSYQEAFGVSLQTLSLQVELDLPLSQVKTPKISVFWAHVPVRIGEVRQINTPKTQSSLEISFQVEEGDQFESSFSYLQSMAKIRLVNPNFAILRQDFQSLKSYPFVVMKGEQKRVHKVNIVGMGLVGTSCLIQLLDKFSGEQQASVEINVFERSQCFGPGLAYSATSHTSLANTQAALMSIDPQDMKHFLAWLKQSKELYQQDFPQVFPVKEGSYIPRQLFGEYLKDQIRMAKQKARKLGIQLQFIAQEVTNVDVESSPAVVITNDGKTYTADFVVLALGNQPTNNFKHLAKYKSYFSSPYPEHEVTELAAKDSDVLVIGTRLSAIDIVLALKAAGHYGKITLASRQGLFPAVRRYFEKTFSEFLNEEDILKEVAENRKSPSQILKIKLQQALKHAYQSEIPNNYLLEQGRQGGGTLEKDYACALDETSHWQKLMVPMVESMEALWSVMTCPQKKDFLNNEFGHILRYIAAFPIQNAQKILSLLQSGEIEIYGKLQTVRYESKSYAFIADYGKEKAEQDYQVVINATGAERNLLESAWPLAKNMSLLELYQFNEFGCFSVNREDLTVKTYRPIAAKVYAPSSSAFGDFLVINFIETCIKHAQIVADDIYRTIAQQA